MIQHSQRVHVRNYLTPLRTVNMEDNVTLTLIWCYFRAAIRHQATHHSDVYITS
jgi:hypothetical protein